MIEFLYSVYHSCEVQILDFREEGKEKREKSISMNNEQKPISYGVPHRSENRYTLPSAKH